MLREGTALPKPEKLKAKTISELDVEIGLGKAEDLGELIAGTSGTTIINE